MTMLVLKVGCQAVVMARVRKVVVVEERRVMHDQMQPRMHFEQPARLEMASSRL